MAALPVLSEKAPEMDFRKGFFLLCGSWATVLYCSQQIKNGYIYNGHLSDDGGGGVCVQVCVWESLIKEGDTERESEGWQKDLQIGCLLKLKSGNELFFCISTSQRDKTEPRSPVYYFNTLHMNKYKVKI